MFRIPQRNIQHPNVEWQQQQNKRGVQDMSVNEHGAGPHGERLDRFTDRTKEDEIPKHRYEHAGIKTQDPLTAAGRVEHQKRPW